jgi:pyruvate kinase
MKKLKEILQKYMTYQQFPQDVKVGERILIDDGKLVLEVTETNEKIL